MPHRPSMLTSRERGNSATRLDRWHGNGDAWTTGNDVRLQPHGRSYFPVLLRSIQAMEDGDLLLFTDWRP